MGIAGVILCSIGVIGVANLFRDRSGLNLVIAFWGLYIGYCLIRAAVKKQDV